MRLVVDDRWLQTVSPQFSKSIVRREYGSFRSHLLSKEIKLNFFQGYSSYGDRNFDNPCISSESESIQVTEMQVSVDYIESGNKFIEHLAYKIVRYILFYFF